MFKYEGFAKDPAIHSSWMHKYLRYGIVPNKCPKIITCKLVPGSQPSFIFYVGARRESLGMRLLQSW